MNTDVPERLPTRPLRNWLLAWRIWTGDPPATIARGFGLDEDVVAELLSPRPPLMMETAGAVDVCRKLRLDPRSMWIGNRPRFDSNRNQIEPADESVMAIIDALGR